MMVLSVVETPYDKISHLEKAVDDAQKPRLLLIWHLILIV